MITNAKKYKSHLKTITVKNKIPKCYNKNPLTIIAV